MITNDVAKLKVHSLYNSTVECLNVFHMLLLVQGAGAIPISEVVTQFATLMFTTAVIHGPSTSILNYNAVSGENVVDVTDDIYTLPVNYSGGGSGDSMPSFCAYSFRFFPAVSGRRSGHKRLGGVSEAAQSAGTITDSSTLTALNAIADVFEDKWQITYNEETYTFVPVIASYTLNGEPRAVPLFTRVASVQALHRVGTQNTRKK